MKKILCILSAMLIFACGCSKKEKTPDFRNVNWGMTMEEVKAMEEMEPSLDGKSTLIYDDIAVAGIVKAKMYYSFFDNKLGIAMYTADKTINDGEITKETYMDLKNSIEKNYGDPKSDGDNGSSAASSWETDTTYILLCLTSGGITLSYSDITVQSTETLSTDGL